MHLSRGKFSTIPMWVKLHDVPLDLWTEEGIKFVASTLGKPMQLDEATLSGPYMKYARVCIEMDASKDIAQKVKLDLGYENPSKIRVEIPWKPTKCKICKVFGHTSFSCAKNPIKPKNPKQKWKPT